MFKQDQEIFNILLETISQSVVIVDNHQHIMEVNQSSETIFGYKASQIIGKNVSLLMPTPYSAEHDNYLENYKRDIIISLKFHLWNMELILII